MSASRKKKNHVWNLIPEEALFPTPLPASSSPASSSLLNFSLLPASHVLFSPYHAQRMEQGHPAMKAFHPDYRQATVSQPGIKSDLKMATLLCHLHPMPLIEVTQEPNLGLNPRWWGPLPSITRLIVSADVEEQTFS